jgi:prephenate dehydratase/chorismate mutase/prephenate dehydratase
VSLRARLRVAFQGELGSFSDEAIQQLYGGDVQRLPYRDFADVTASVASGIAERGVLPIENTMAGSIAGAHDAISGLPGLYVVAETVVAVHHCLLGPPTTTFEQIATVLCHPVALAQCRQFFAENPQLEIHPSYDTAGAAMDVSKVADPAFAAVASRRAALHYSLQVLRSDIEDRRDNQTRFLAVSRTPVPLPDGTPARTMFLVTTDDAPGSLLTVLTPLATHGISVRRLESRPTGEPWSYRFFVEFDHAVGDEDAIAVIAEISERSATARHLGTFPRWGAGRRESVDGSSGSVLPL